MKVFWDGRQVFPVPQKKWSRADARRLHQKTIITLDSKGGISLRWGKVFVWVGISTHRLMVFSKKRGRVKGFATPHVGLVWEG